MTDAFENVIPVLEKALENIEAANHELGEVNEYYYGTDCSTAALDIARSVSLARSGITQALGLVQYHKNRITIDE